MTDRERPGYLAVMASALPRLRAADPWAAPRLVPDSRRRPDSFLVGRDLAHVIVTGPATLAARRARARPPQGPAKDRRVAVIGSVLEHGSERIGDQQALRVAIERLGRRGVQAGFVLSVQDVELQEEQATC
jgi:hypothetical protein